MTKMFLQRKHEVPPGGWSYTQFETGARLSAGSWIDLVAAVKKHRLANNLPVGTDFEGEIEDQICQRMPAGICDRAGQPGRSGSLNFDAVISGTKTLATWLAGGRKRVDADELKRRVSICSSCYLNQPIDGCTSCSQRLLDETVKFVVGQTEFEGSGFLNSCVACSCLLKAKVQLPLDLLQRNTSNEVNERLPDHCWLKRQL